MFVYMFSGFCAALVGLIISSELMAAHPATGETFELNAIAAAVLGGTSMSGGRGTIGGTIIGAFVIGILSDGLVMMGVSSFWQMVIKGLVIIAAVVVDQAQRRLQQRVRAAPHGAGRADMALRGALIGCGFFAVNHLHAWRDVEGAEIVGDLRPRPGPAGGGGPRVRHRPALCRRRGDAGARDARLRRHRDHGAEPPAARRAGRAAPACR